jgi:uncharacterized protein YndB with AHSA1/START domain
MPTGGRNQRKERDTVTAKTHRKLIVSTPSDLEIRMERTFDAPREVVFNAFIDPELIPRWWGMRGTTTTVDTLEPVAGGRWRFVNAGADGTEHAFRGKFLEVTPPERITWTFEYEPMAGHVTVETSTFEEHDGKTTVTAVSVFDNVEDRDGMLNSGMEVGATETYDRLEELLATLV